MNDTIFKMDDPLVTCNRFFFFYQVNRMYHVLKIRYVRMGILVEWKKPVCSSEDVDSNGMRSTLNVFVSVFRLIPSLSQFSEDIIDLPHPFKNVLNVSSFRKVAAIINSLTP